MSSIDFPVFLGLKFSVGIISSKNKTSRNRFSPNYTLLSSFVRSLACGECRHAKTLKTLGVVPLPSPLPILHKKYRKKFQFPLSNIGIYAYYEPVFFDSWNIYFYSLPWYIGYHTCSSLQFPASQAQITFNKVLYFLPLTHMWLVIMYELIF